MKQILILSMLLLLLGCETQNQLEMNVVETKVGTVEVVIFQFADGINEEMALQKAAALNAWVQEQNGFISRKLSKTEDGKWIDVVHWESLDFAQKANEAAMQSQVALAFFELIDQESMQFMHATPQLDFKK